MGDTNLHMARREYTIMLCQKLYKPLYQGIRYYWDLSKRTARPGEVYADFQKKLRLIKHWNQDVIESEYKRVIEKSDCQWLEDLIKTVLLCNTQILAAIDRRNPQQKIKVVVPKGEKFLHRCYTECARAFYENVWLMEDRPEFITSVEHAKHVQKAYKLITTCIENTIRNLLPIEELMRQTLIVEGENNENSVPPHYSFGTAGAFGQTAWNLGQQSQFSIHGDSAQTHSSHVMNHPTYNSPLVPTSTIQQIGTNAPLTKDYTHISSMLFRDTNNDDEKNDEDDDKNDEDDRSHDDDRRSQSDEDGAERETDKRDNDNDLHHSLRMFERNSKLESANERDDDDHDLDHDQKDSQSQRDQDERVFDYNQNSLEDKKDQRDSPVPNFQKEIEKIIYFSRRQSSPKRPKSPVSDTEEVPDAKAGMDYSESKDIIHDVPTIREADAGNLALDVLPTDETMFKLSDEPLPDIRDEQYERQHDDDNVDVDKQDFFEN